MAIGPTTTNVRPSVLQLMVENAMDGHYVVDRERDIFIRVNPAFCDLCGFREEELLLDDFHSIDLIHPEDREEVLRAREGSNHEQATLELRFRMVTKRNEVRMVECRTRTSRSMGRLVSVGSCRDISEQVELERKVRNQLDSSQTRVRESNRAMLEVANANNRLFQMVESLKAVPELSKRLSALDHVNDVVKQACLYITNQEAGLQFGSCVIYLRSGERLEVAYANPFRMTSCITIQGNELFHRLLSGQSEMEVTETGNRMVPMRDSEHIIGILEVGVGRVLERIFSQDDQVRRAQENVIKSIADFIGIQIANLKLRDKIQQQVIEDALTHLHNRRHFDDKIAAEFKRAARYSRDLALLLFDIDHFKVVNDTHGHPQGDVALQTLSTVLKGSFRDLDTVCRTGGEEFAVIMPETAVDAAAAKAEQIRQAIEHMDIPLKVSQAPHQPGDTMRITISIGVAAVDPSIENAEHLYREADRMLYHAKNSGRNRVCSA